MNKIIIPKELSNDLAYICGVLAGDGSINFRTEKHEYLVKCVGNPKDEKEFYNNVIGPKFYELFGISLNLKLHDSNTTFGFVIYSKELVNYLTSVIGLPLGRKYGTLKVPSLFYNNQDLLINFIRGLFDTDGSVSFKKRHRDYNYYPVICLTSRSENFVRQCSEILKSLGFSFFEIYNYKVKDERVKGGFTTISRIEINGARNLKLWIEKIGFYSPKHLSKINLFLKKE